jgi:hypothetical protein
VNPVAGTFTAQATDASGNSSEYGDCWSAPQPQADVTLVADPDLEQVDPGDDALFVLELGNAGPLLASDVVVQVPRPDGCGSWSADPAGSYDETSGE